MGPDMANIAICGLSRVRIADPGGSTALLRRFRAEGNGSGNVPVIVLDDRADGGAAGQFISPSEDFPITERNNIENGVADGPVRAGTVTRLVLILTT